jgi:hypothetical protein
VHLPKSKAAELKKIARPEDGSYWISSYDAYMAYIWRLLSKHRAKLFKPDPKHNLLWSETVDMRRRLFNPPVPHRIQGNVVFVALSTQNPTPQLTVEEVISTAPLSKLAWYTRSFPSLSSLPCVYHASTPRPVSWAPLEAISLHPSLPHSPPDTSRRSNDSL